MTGESEYRPTEFTFDQDPEVVAEQLRGAVILTEKKRFISKILFKNL